MTTVSTSVDIRSGPVTGSRSSRWEERRAGARAIVPLLLGIAPFGFAIGAAASETGAALAGWASSPLLFGGSAQMATIDLLDRGAAAGVVVATVLAINLRFVLSAAALAPHWRDQSPWWRALASFAIVEQLAVVALARYESGATAEQKRDFYSGAACVLAAGWISATTLGVGVGGSLPTALGLDLALPLAVMGLVATALHDRPGVVATGAAVLVALAATGLPYRSGVLVAALAAMVVGRLSDGAMREGRP